MPTSPAPALTRNQKLVFEALTADEQPLSAYTLLDRLRDDGLRSPLQIYRALDKLVDFGLVHKLESTSTFVPCRDPDTHVHGPAAFAICESCGQVDEFTDAVVEEQVERWARERSFQPKKTTIEIRGTCSACAQAQGAA